LAFSKSGDLRKKSRKFIAFGDRNFRQLSVSHAVLTISHAVLTISHAVLTISHAVLTISHAVAELVEATVCCTYAKSTAA
jgi:hypothetical protein